MRTALALALITAATPALAQTTRPAPTSSRAAASKPAAAPAPTEEEQEEEQPPPPPPRWTLEASVGATAGYNDNISLTPLVRPGEQQAAWTTEVSGKVKPALRLAPHLKAKLGYSFNQTIYYGHSELDTQTHELAPALKWSSERLDASVSYGFQLHALVPKNTLYSLEHVAKGSTEILIKGPFYVGLDYTFHYYDVRDAEYAYLAGQIHTVEVYPELYFEEKLTAYLGYKLEVARLGVQADRFQGGVQGQVNVDVLSAQSYNGHYAYLHLEWLPHPRLTLTLDAELGRRSYFESSVRGQGPGPGPGGGKQNAFARVDTVFSASFAPSFRFWRGFSVNGYFGYEKSSSSVRATALQSSYDNFVGTLGLSWEHP